MKQIGLLIAWLSGSLAGITAGLYALGFVATIGADALLGIDAALIVRDPAFYIGRGASLLIRTLLIGMLSALPIIAIGEGVGWLCKREAITRLDASGRARRILGAAVAPAASLAMLYLALVGLKGYILLRATCSSPARSARTFDDREEPDPPDGRTYPEPEEGVTPTTPGVKIRRPTRSVDVE